MRFHIFFSLFKLLLMIFVHLIIINGWYFIIIKFSAHIFVQYIFMTCINNKY